MGSYFGRRHFPWTFARAGLTITFHSWAHPLEDDSRALEQAGFLLEAVREPPYPGDDDGRDRRIPMFLWFRALKPNPHASDTLQ